MWYDHSSNSRIGEEGPRAGGSPSQGDDHKWIMKTLDCQRRKGTISCQMSSWTQVTQDISMPVKPLLRPAATKANGVRGCTSTSWRLRAVILILSSTTRRLIFSFFRLLQRLSRLWRLRPRPSKNDVKVCWPSRDAFPTCRTTLGTICNTTTY